MIGKTNCGNGSGSSFNGALIHVIAPVGSTISFIKGNIIVKILQDNDGHIDSNDNNKRNWYYPISLNNQEDQEDWIIQSTKDGMIERQQISILSNLEYDITITYSAYVVHNGILQSGYDLYPYTSSTYNATMRQDSDCVYIAYSGASSGSAGAIGVLGNIDYDYLVLTASAGYTTDDNFNKFAITTSDNKNNINFTVAQIKLGNYNSDSTSKTWVLDVHSVSLEDKYISIAPFNSDRYLKVTQLYFTNEVPQ